MCVEWERARAHTKRAHEPRATSCGLGKEAKCGFWKIEHRGPGWGGGGGGGWREKIEDLGGRGGRRLKSFNRMMNGILVYQKHIYIYAYIYIYIYIYAYVYVYIHINTTPMRCIIGVECYWSQYSTFLQVFLLLSEVYFRCWVLLSSVECYWALCRVLIIEFDHRH